MNQNPDIALLEELEAQRDLHNLNTRYCRGADRMDADMLGSVWTRDAQVDCGAFKGPAQEFTTAVTTPDAVRERSYHAISNEYYEVDGDTARGEVYLIAISTLVENGSKNDQWIGGRYLDTYKREDGAWKIATRAFVMDWNMNKPTTAVWDEGLFGMIKLRGTRDRSDPVYALLGAQA